MKYRYNLILVVIDKLINFIRIKPYNEVSSVE